LFKILFNNYFHFVEVGALIHSILPAISMSLTQGRKVVDLTHNLMTLKKVDHLFIDLTRSGFLQMFLN